MELLKQIRAKVIEGRIDEVVDFTKTAIERKVDIQEIINISYIGGLDIVGEKYSSGELFLPEMLLAGMAVSSGMKIIKPLLTEAGTEPKGTIVLGTVKGDSHDIGKNIVGMMMEGGGFRVIDIGTDVGSGQFIQAALDSKANIIGISALLSTTRDNIPGIIADIRNSSLSRTRIIVGGAPLTQSFADNIGADGYAPDAALAVKVAKALLGVD